jgi:hypothetical protein
MAMGRLMHGTQTAVEAGHDGRTYPMSLRLSLQEKLLALAYRLINFVELAESLV